MSYQSYHRTLNVHWRALGKNCDNFLKHYDGIHGTRNYIVQGDQVITADGLLLSEGQALVRELIHSDYLLYVSLKAFWDLFIRTRLEKDEKLLTFTGRSLMEMYERRICLLATAPIAVVKRKKEKYMFTGAHIWQDKVDFAAKLLAQMKRDNRLLIPKSQVLTQLVEQKKLKPVMKEMGFYDPQYAKAGKFLSSSELENRPNLYAVYSLAIHGDPFVGAALEYQSTDKWHFLLPKTLHILLACECANIMLESLGNEHCEECRMFKNQFARLGKHIKDYVDSNVELLDKERITVNL